MFALTSWPRVRPGLDAAMLLAACVMALAACAPIPEVEFKPALEQRFSARKQPAEVTRASDKELGNQGYVRIGEVIVRHLEGKSYASDSATACREQAARKGGDLVRMSEINRSATETEWVNTCAEYSSFVSRQYYCPASGSCYYRDVRTRNCIRWDRNPVEHAVIRSKAAVWRLEPQLALRKRLGKAFLLAVAKGDLAGVQEPLAQGIDPNLRDGKGRSPLLVAAERGHLPLVKALVEHGADVHAATGEYKRTPLIGAVAEGHAEVAAFLLQRGAKVDHRHGTERQTPLIVAARNGRTAVARMLLEQGADPSLATKDGNTALTDAAHYGHLDIVRLLLDHGADIEQGTRHDWTPLMATALRGHTKVARLLLDRGAKPNARNSYGGLLADDAEKRLCCTALDVALAFGKQETAALLKERGATATERASAPRTSRPTATAKTSASRPPAAGYSPSEGEAPLITAAATGDLSAVQKLLAQGADPNAEIEGSRVTALIRAAEHGHAEIVRLLLDHGADIDHSHITGSALAYASLNEHTEVLRLLLERGADPNTKTVLRSTPLMLEAAYGHAENVRLLLARGADLTPKDYRGRTALDRARDGGHSEIAKMLREAGGR